MRNYIILNNQRSDEISGLIIQELAPISKPLQRTQVETIDGRDGDIVTPLGYAAYDKKITIGLYGDFDINEIIAYFATQGTAIFSNEPDKYYNYQILDQIDYERLVRFRVATITMHVQPFKYSATEGTLTIDASDTVSGEGSEIALDNTAEAPFTTLRHKGNATQTTYSGKNLASLETSATKNIGGVSFSIVDGIIRLNGTTETNKNFYFDSFQTNTGSAMFWLEVTGYTVPESGNASFILQSSTDNSNWSNFKELTFRTLAPSEQITLDSTKYYRLRWYVNGNTFTNATIKVQLEYGTTKTNFEQYVGGTASPNPDYPQDISLLTGDSTIAIDDGGDNSQEYVIPFGDTYLAAIGDYADEPVKVGDTWYIRRAIGKVVLDGSSDEGWSIIQSGNCFNKVQSDIKQGSSDAEISDVIISDYYSPTSYNLNYSGQGGSGITSPMPAPRISIRNASINTLAGFTTWLSAHPTTVYYVLATPTDEEITDQDLIDALDEFYGQAHSYKGHTHIAATAEDGNAPAILSVEVGEDNESTVTNAGNTTSRPILTIYGQGDIGVYINDVEVLDIALGNEQYITLDSTEMDAYKDSPANLKNRLVAGDYSKLALNAGANKIRFTGNVTKYEISKYSRWL